MKTLRIYKNLELVIHGTGKPERLLKYANRVANQYKLAGHRVNVVIS